ncbi:MAG: hypothetical protein ACJAXY_001917 [Nonlabens sp.]|jgi:hypothetical protein
MSLLYGTTQVMAENNGLLAIKRSYFGEESTVFFNENAISMNIALNDARFRKIGTAINAIETDKNIQIKAGNFMILQIKKEDKNAVN